MGEQWHFERKGCLILEGTKRIAHVGVAGFGEEELQEHGHLLAAAPDMRNAGAEFDRLSLVIESAVRNADPVNHEAVLAAIKANRAAIARAEGKATP